MRMFEGFLLMALTALFAIAVPAAAAPREWAAAAR